MWAYEKWALTSFIYGDLWKFLWLLWMGLLADETHLALISYVANRAFWAGARANCMECVLKQGDVSLWEMGTYQFHIWGTLWKFPWLLWMGLLEDETHLALRPNVAKRAYLLEPGQIAWNASLWEMGTMRFISWGLVTISLAFVNGFAGRWNPPGSHIICSQ